ncbi:hypothetical protein [Reyranella sp.]|uniref:hypothetical protein n=1 Tax=Reyranella sp. TaxID=1929291 RepID=UPI0037838864
MKRILAVIALVLWSGIAAAQHSHGNVKGPNGGPMHDVAGVHAELVMSGNVLTINLFDEANKPVSSKGFSGSVLLVSGNARETIQLAVSGDAALKGEAKAPIASGAQVTLVLKNAAGKSGQVKF